VFAVSGEAASQKFAAAPLDRPTRWVTAAFCAALLGVALTVPAAAADIGSSVLLGLVFPLGGVALAYGFAPRSYAITPDGLLQVRRHWFGVKTFRLETAQTVAAVFGLGGIRIFGSGGAFGWYGLFWRKGTGRYRAYVTDRSSLVVCQGPDGLVTISPADPEAFVAAVPVGP
jgi:hypothetical protein